LAREGRRFTDANTPSSVCSPTRYAALTPAITSQMTITEITYAVGFSDLKHFRSVFRGQFGVPPGDYPKRSSVGPTS
jgi:AraC-like DNA-binding protein